MKIATAKPIIKDGETNLTSKFRACSFRGSLSKMFDEVFT